MDAVLRSEIQNEIQAAVQNAQTDILNSITSALDSRFEVFRKTFQSTQKALADTQMAKIDETLADNYKFKKRGNEEQHKHNNKVFVKLKEAKNQLENAVITEENIDTAKERITEGMELLRNRQKLIKLADSSEAGWRVVAEYTANPLADDSEDEKRIYKAQSRAESKIKKEKVKRKSSSGSFIPTIKVTRNEMPGKCFNCNEKECPHLTKDKDVQNKISNEF